MSEFVHPLTDAEKDLFDQFAHDWSGDPVGLQMTKTLPLSDALKGRLVALGEVFHLTVTFPVDKDGQHYLHAVRNAPLPKEKTPHLYK